MISLVEALNYRCLRDVSQELGSFHVLVGPNATGKTTFLDVIGFAGHLVKDGLDAALDERTANFSDLLWGRAGSKFELALEAPIPERLRQVEQSKDYDTIRYELSVGVDPDTEQVGILAERGLFKMATRSTVQPPELFPQQRVPRETVLSPSRGRFRTVFNKVYGGNDNFYSEVYKESGKGWAPSFRLGSRKSTLGNLPDDEAKFPVSLWLMDLLTSGLQRLVLNSQLIRNASPPGQGRGFLPDGSNLPWVVEELKQRDHVRFAQWVEHLRTALPDLGDIRTVERPEDRHRYLVLKYREGLEVPSWMASDGTLRLLALTITAYLREFEGIYLVEEPENGIHPRAVETMFQSLTSVYGAQVLVATHSPVILSVVEANKVLCFAKAPNGSADIVLGSSHPALADWRRETNLGELFAAGVLG